jgi:hypothetical protein
MQSAWGSYLRSHKKDPLYLLSIFMAVSNTIVVYCFGQLFAIDGVVLGYLVLTIIASIIAWKIFNNCKIKWHSNSIS